MKKIISILLVVQFFLCIAVFGENELVVSYKNSLVNNERVQFVTVKGNVGISYDRVFVSITDSSSNLYGLAQTLSDENGDFSCTLGIKSPADEITYQVLVNSEKTNSKKTVDMTVKSETELNGKISMLNNDADSSDELKALLSQYSDELGLDTTFFTGDNSDSIASFMYGYCGELTLYNVAEKFDSAVICGILNDPEASAEVKTAVLTYYDDAYIGLKSDEEASGVYDTFKNMDTDMKEAVIDRLCLTSVNDKSEVKDKFLEAVVMTVINDMSVEEADKFILENNDYLKLNDYENGSDGKRFAYINAIKSASPDNFVELNSAYSNIYNLENTPALPPAISGGGGGGGGGGGSTIGYEKPKDSENSVPSVPGENFEQQGTVAFSDLEGYDWAKTSIDALFVKEIIKGKESGKFCPGDNITRAEFVKMITLAFGVYDENAVSDFSDVPENAWYNSYVASAVKAGIVSGTSATTFSPSKLITREDMATIIYRYLNLNKKILVYEKLENKFEDFSAISSYAQNSVLMLSNMGVINGKNNNQFCPADNATRAESCVMIYNSLEVARND